MPARTTALTAGEDREVIRLVAPIVLWWVWLAFVAVNIGDFAIQGLSSARFGAVVSAILLFVTGLVYTLALRPRVVTDKAGLTVVNPYRTHWIPWPLIQSVDTGEWVRVQYGLPVADSGGRPTRTLYCWALFVSSRARRKIARGPRPQRRAFFDGGISRRAGMDAGYGTAAADSSRLPEEARHLASLPVTQAIATRLDTRAARERARAHQEEPEQATASWSVPALAAAGIPALILLVVALIRPDP
jgi:hypothetical protein